MTAFVAKARAKVIRREQTVIVAVVIALTAAAWAHIVGMTHDTVELTGGVVGPVMSCCGVDLTLTFIMWVVMMVGMMLPSAVPMILAFTSVHCERGHRGVFLSSCLFVAGYLVVWTVFSAVAAGGQWALFHWGMLDPAKQTVAPLAGGILLVAAGLFQLTPLKTACLSGCRAPLSFVRRHWRDGRLGALAMGVRHGVACAGTCSLLMLVLFVVGVMNLAWVLVVTAFVIAEKALPWKRAVVWTGAGACLLSGFAMIGHTLHG